MDIWNVLQDRVANDGAKGTVGVGKGIAPRLGQCKVGTTLLCFAENAGRRIHAASQRQGEGDRGKVSVSAADVQHGFLERQKILVEACLDGSQQSAEGGQIAQMSPEKVFVSHVMCGWLLGPMLLGLGPAGCLLPDRL